MRSSAGAPAWADTCGGSVHTCIPNGRVQACRRRHARLARRSSRRAQLSLLAGRPTLVRARAPAGAARPGPIHQQPQSSDDRRTCTNTYRSRPTLIQNRIRRRRQCASPPTNIQHCYTSTHMHKYL